MILAVLSPNATWQWLFDRLRDRAPVYRAENGLHCNLRVSRAHDFPHNRDTMCSGGQAQRGAVCGYAAERDDRTRCCCNDARQTVDTEGRAVAGLAGGDEDWAERDVISAGTQERRSLLGGVRRSADQRAGKPRARRLGARAARQVHAACAHVERCVDIIVDRDRRSAAAAERHERTQERPPIRRRQILLTQAEPAAPTVKGRFGEFVERPPGLMAVRYDQKRWDWKAHLSKLRLLVLQVITIQMSEGWKSAETTLSTMMHLYKAAGHRCRVFECAPGPDRDDLVELNSLEFVFSDLASQNPTLAGDESEVDRQVDKCQHTPNIPPP